MIDRTDFYAAKLAFETDASDVYAALKAGEELFVIDVRSDEAWAQGRVAGAVHMHYSEIAARAAAARRLADSKALSQFAYRGEAGST